MLGRASKCLDPPNHLVGVPWHSRDKCQRRFKSVGGAPMFKTEGKKNKEGNYDVEASCPKGHTCYKKRGDRETYKCPYCGYDVP